MQISVVGSGYVGLVAGACFADLGHDVILVDNDAQKLSALQSGSVPIHETFLPELLERHRGTRLNFCGNLAEAVRASAAIFIAQSMATRLSWRRARFRSIPAIGCVPSCCAMGLNPSHLTWPPTPSS